MNSKISIIKKVLSVVTIILLFLPWFSYSASGGGAKFGFGYIGLATIGADIIPLALIVLLIKSVDNEKTNKIYLYVSIAGVAITLLVGLLYPEITSKFSTSAVSQKMSWSWGIWLSLLVYIALLVISIIGLKQGNGSVGLDGFASNSGFITQDIQGKAKDITNSIQSGIKKAAYVECPNCGNKVLKGKKFCGKCGNPMPQDVQVKSNHSVADVNCAKCGSKLPKGAKFCLECGAKVEMQPQKTICPTCGVELPNGAKFCAQCGTKIGG